MKALPLIAGLIALALGCHSSVEHQELTPVEAPIVLAGAAFDLAGVTELPVTAPIDFPGLLNVFHLSETIISGSEPEGQAALETLASMGVRTIISVDGKAPAVEAAAALGMRYVHIPFQYKGIGPTDMASLAKTYRELEAPFYVHCFHGKHRGPAGAAIGRVVRDGATREAAISEMRQYSGTSKKYEGLYRSVAARLIPSSEDTAQLAYDFPAVELPEGIVGAMVPVARTHDYLELLRDNNWQPLALMPDVDALNEAVIMHDAFVAGANTPDVQEGAQRLQDMWATATKDSAALVAALVEFNAIPTPSKAIKATRHFESIQASCTDCHSEFRNDE